MFIVDKYSWSNVGGFQGQAFIFVWWWLESVGWSDYGPFLLIFIGLSMVLLIWEELKIVFGSYRWEIAEIG